MNRAVSAKMGSYTAQTALMACSTILVSAIALIASGHEASAWALASGLACCTLFALLSRARRNEILRLAAEIDEVLHNAKRTRFSDCKEGDVAVLKNELTKMVERLCRLNEELSREKRALADSLADVSHQIRTPLTSIGLLIPLIERAESEGERNRRLRELEALSERVSWLVTALLKIAKLDAGTLTVEKRLVNASEALDRAIEPLSIPLDLRQITLVRTLDRTATFQGDESWTAEALANILKNCMEHTPEGGRICVQVRQTATACSIRIEDDGTGIAEEDLPRIFDRFYRGRRPIEHDRMQPQGFGIGLSLAMELVSAQGGSLRASNAIEGGAAFEVTFPKMTV